MAHPSSDTRPTRKPFRKGHPRTFGWLRRPEKDREGKEAWERPDGGIVLFVKGTKLEVTKWA